MDLTVIQSRLHSAGLCQCVGAKAHRSTSSRRSVQPFVRAVSLFLKKVAELPPKSKKCLLHEGVFHAIHFLV